MSFENVSRKALIVGCPGPQNNYLAGVRSDLDNIKRFLQSNKGGSWNEDEITTLVNPTESELIRSAQSHDSNYSFIYFSGHGATDLNGKRLLAVMDKSISDLHLLNNCSKQLIIIDACRTAVSGLGGLPEFEPHISHFEEYSTYELFSELIALSPQGKLIVHATQRGVSAGDTPLGGVFTRALLNLAKRMVSEHEYSPCSIVSILDFIPEVTAAMRKIQKPEVVYSSGNLTVPFTFSLSFAEKEALRQGQTKKGFSLSPIVGVSLLALLLILVVVSSD